MIEFRINGEYDNYLEELDCTAITFFNIDKDCTQIMADKKTYNYSVRIGGSTAMAIEDEKLLGWCFAFPTSRKLMVQFLNDSISEKELFWSTKKNKKYDVIYLCAAYVYSSHRKTGLGSKLIDECLKPLLKDGVCIFYEPYTKKGKRLGESALKDYKYEIKIKEHK